MKKKSIVKEVAKFIALYDGDSEQENMELARQIVAKVKRHLTQRAADDFSGTHNHPILARCTCAGCVRRRKSNRR